MDFLTRLICVLLLAVVPAAPASASAPSGSRPATAITTPAPEPSGFGLRLLDIPADLKDDLRARSYIVDRVAPGTEISRRLRVENNTGAPQTVRIYPGAAQIRDGSFTGEGVDVASDLTLWAAVERQQLRLAPGESADVPATINVPADAPEGEHYGVFWAEIRGTAGAGGVIAVNRVGVRIYLSVGPGGGKAADFTITSVTVARDTEGNPQLKAVVTNSGGRALDLTGELSLTAGPGGLSAGPFGLQQQTTLAPGEVRTADFSVPREIPNGPWNARVTLKSGLLERQAQTRITFPDDGPPTESVAKPAQEPAAPWWQILAALVLLAAALAWVLMRRSRRTRPAPDDPV
ncbi:hypothetical protein QFZ79_001459 [Arthrobacter sp. V4I6]|uniref:hypothetical protein n=1 Tax=unclassified Arthrobacter TaxID=235627 RepID=UPI0027894C01|nr:MULTISPECIES: hypothetical protein [unclassified Arthrobacter]MDQ0819165.1 hypothetical protein [Arthrobacter sp. V1I7]MDQ0853348.1 hypothetical protein [Arthrobacter sp. V4I6]